MLINYYDNPIKIQEFIWQLVKDLSQENIDKILNFILYIRQKKIDIELFDVDYEILNKELVQKSILETLHLEQEFENYKIEFPHE